MDWLVARTVRYTDIPKISVLNQYRYIDTGYSTIPIYRNFRYTRIFQYIVLNLPTIWRNHNLYFATEWQFKELSTVHNDLEFPLHEILHCLSTCRSKHVRNSFDIIVFPFRITQNFLKISIKEFSFIIIKGKTNNFFGIPIPEISHTEHS